MTFEPVVAHVLVLVHCALVRCLAMAVDYWGWSRSTTTARGWRSTPTIVAFAGNGSIKR
jgi:hypothetical protein